MADKILRIIFNGISTLYPGPPRTKDETPPDKALVLMAANYEGRTNDWDAPVAPHFPFVYVPESFLGGLISEPDDRAEDSKLGRCNVYYLENARVTFDPPPPETLHYYIDQENDLGERPGSDDVANEHDIRWLADIRDLLSGEVSLKSDPNAPGPEVAAIVELTGGTLKAGFPCKSVQTQTFRAANGKTIQGMKRVLASEFSIDMTYPETTPQVKLRLRPLRMDAFMAGISLNELTLRWPEKGGLLVVRIGNDTKREARLASSLKRCDARLRSSDGKLVPKPRDDDFFLHYELLNIPPETARPLPQAGPHQTDGDHCKPAGG
jgi:hypothetical protein